MTENNIGENDESFDKTELNSKLVSISDLMKNNRNYGISHIKIEN